MKTEAVSGFVVSLDFISSLNDSILSRNYTG